MKKENKNPPQASRKSKQAKKMLIESEEKFFSISELANEAIFVIGMDGNIKDANNKASEI